ncbi:MAG: hypothetical protein R2764_00865 [Bacteroidales bacterium]
MFSQTNNQKKTNYAEYPYWIEMMQDHSVNFYEVQEVFNTYWENREVTKGSGWKPYKDGNGGPNAISIPMVPGMKPDKVYNEYQKVYFEKSASKE